LEDGSAASAAENWIGRALRVRHHAQDVATVVDETGNVTRGAVGIIKIAEDDAALAFDAGECVFAGDEAAVTVGDRNFDFALFAIGADEHGVGVCDRQ